MAPPNVSLRGVALRRPGAHILRSVDLTLQPASATALVGANGSGKTTLLRVLATLTRPSAGEGEILGAALGSPDVEAVRPRIGLIGHEPALYPNLTLLENLELVAALFERGPHRPRETLGMVGLSDAADRRVRHSSNGMKRRLEVARMLVAEPILLLLDEAHVGLDAGARGLVSHLVSEVVARNGSALVVAHDEAVVSSVVHRTLHLADGSVTEAA